MAKKANPFISALAAMDADEHTGVPLSVLQEMGGWESIEMVRRYAHLAPNHLTEHARQIDSILGFCVPNMSHTGNKEDLKEA
ncbi:hypothetical protein ESA_02754 [Cronobacter sakazakii ATCC BAA-894]|uniref:Tyr recombinase domain-containing protein n=1 Tax=Cronobacter sakazakii (strain ATCC BAA-894) TaxID=290339 RepID=A7MJZ5_CROS8|nr:hypothetical protein ESA_02754 [Cronobacter sakazakii ATCC BAA-894]